MKRGDIVTVAAGSGFGSKPRPALVFQDDALGELANIVLALFTSAIGNGRRIRPRFEPDTANGLRVPSDLMTDILVTVPRDRVGGIIGHLSAADMARAETALLTVLGFAHSRRQ